MTYRYREFVTLLVVSKPVSKKIGTGKKSRNRYRKNLVPEKVWESVSEKFGTGNVSEPASEKFGTRTDFRRIILGNGYRYREFSFFLVVSEKFGTGKSLGTGIGKKLVPELIFVNEI